MLVYHYINVKHGLEDIRERRLKISRIMELNDPFEFLGADLSDPNFRRALQKTKADVSQTKGILCFSKTWRNPVLWSHYADKHRGLCLGFEVSDAILGKVEYVESRLHVPSKIDEEFIERILFTKFKHWEYEQEYRVYTELKEHIDGIYYSEFSEQIRLRKVIVGVRSTITRAQVHEALGPLRPEVETFKARAGFTKFEVVRQRNSTKW